MFKEDSDFKFTIIDDKDKKQREKALKDAEDRRQLKNQKRKKGWTGVVDV